MNFKASVECFETAPTARERSRGTFIRDLMKDTSEVRGVSHLPEPDYLFAVACVVTIDRVPLPVLQIHLLHATQHHLQTHKRPVTESFRRVQAAQTHRDAPPAPSHRSTAATAAAPPR